MQHYTFNVSYAIKYGVDEAIMIQNFQFWIEKNLANKKHNYDGRIWTYNSIEAFSILFPFWTTKQIRRILKSLIDKEVLQKGNYSKNTYDRTCWYSFVNQSEFIQDFSHMPKQANGKAQTGRTKSPNRQNEKPKQAERKAQTGEPITYIKPDTLPDGVKPLDKSMYVNLCKKRDKGDDLKQSDIAYIEAYEQQQKILAGIDFDDRYVKPRNSIEIPEPIKLFHHSIKNSVGESSYKSWFRNITSFENNDNCIVLFVQNEFCKKYIEENYYSEINQAVSQCFSDAVTYALKVKK